MADALLCNGNAGFGASYVSWALSSSVIYAEAEIYLPASTLTDWRSFQGATSDPIGNIDSGSNLVYLTDTGSGSYDAWTDDWISTPLAGHAAGDVWHTVRWSALPSGETMHVEVDGDDSTYTLGFGFGTMGSVKFGPSSGYRKPVYLGRLRIGTTLGGFDLLDYAPAADGAPAAFGFTVHNDVTLVTAPTPPPSSTPPSSGPVFVSAYVADDQLTVTMDQPLQTVPGTTAAEWTVSADSFDVPVVSAAISGSDVLLGLAWPLTQGELPLVSYAEVVPPPPPTGRQLKLAVSLAGRTRIELPRRAPRLLSSLPGP